MLLPFRQSVEKVQAVNVKMGHVRLFALCRVLASPPLNVGVRQGL